MKVGHSAQDPALVAKELSRQINLPGEYSVFSAVKCHDSEELSQTIKNSIASYQSAGDFYELAPQMALHIINRDTMRIPVVVNTSPY